MGLGSRIYDKEEQLKILFGLIDSHQNQFPKSGYIELYDEINDYFKLKYYLSECRDGNSMSKLNDELLKKLLKINVLIKQKLNDEQLKFISSCITERYENSNLQHITTETEYIVTPDPELINNPKFANIT
jgi:hypothetical protein